MTATGSYVTTELPVEKWLEETVCALTAKLVSLAAFAEHKMAGEIAVEKFLSQACEREVYCDVE